jgi:hypothetical protein
MFADLALPSRTCPKTLGRHSLGVGGKSATRLSKIIFPVHGKAQLQQSSTAEDWLVLPEKNTDSADGTGPLFAGFVDYQIPTASQRGICKCSRNFVGNGLLHVDLRHP